MDLGIGHGLLVASFFFCGLPFFYYLVLEYTTLYNICMYRTIQKECYFAMLLKEQESNCENGCYFELNGVN